MDGPYSSYSSRVTHWLENVANDARTLPPIHTRYLRSGGATTLTVEAAGAMAVISLVNLRCMWEDRDDHVSARRASGMQGDILFGNVA